METILEYLEAAPSERASMPKAGVLPAFLGLTVLFSLADAGSWGLFVTTALAAAKAALVLYFIPDLGL